MYLRRVRALNIMKQDFSTVQYFTFTVPGLLTIVLLYEVFGPRRAQYLAECSDLGLYRLLYEQTKRLACLCCGVHVFASYVHVESWCLQAPR